MDNRRPMKARSASSENTAVDSLVRWTRSGMIVSSWVSASLFGLYVLAFYAGAMIDGTPAHWNDNLSGLYAPHASVSTVGIGAHFAAGGIILALGCVQLLAPVRTRWPRLHRWVGRIYVTASLVAGLGGIAFILTRGTIGGAVMDAGFLAYGLLTTVCAVQAWRHARARRLDLHRAWAMRLFALAIGSWLYRMDYGFWLLLANGIGHTHDFHGPFDNFMAFFFYVPNLLIVETLLRVRRAGASQALKLGVVGMFVGATALIAVGTYYFTRFYWGPAILHRLAALSAPRYH